MAKKRLYLDVHVIQTLPPSCVNRDDTNTPKTCVYGGKMRARVSSQCWKRAERDYFGEHIDDGDVEMCGVRTRKLANAIAETLNESGDSRMETTEAEDIAKAVMEAIGLSSGKDDAKSTIVFMSHKQISAIADAIMENKEEIYEAYENVKKEKEKGKKNKNDKDIKMKLKKETQKSINAAAKNNPSADILLFGRMMASAHDLEYDAACQVAHAISTNEVHVEQDYFSATDEIQDYFSAIDEPNSSSNNAAAHIGVKDFVDPVFYRYTTINLSETSELLREENGAKEYAPKIARNCVEAFVLSMPTGSQNSYANHTLPDYIMVTLREDMPVSFAPAFIDTVIGKTKSYKDESVEKLEDYADWVSENYGKPVFMRKLPGTPLHKILKDIEEAVSERI